jgi:hypothetical protein
LHWRIFVSLPSVGKIFGQKDNRYLIAGTDFVRWNDIRERVSAILTASVPSGGRDNVGPTDRHSLAVSAAPIAIDRISARIAGSD